MKLPLSQLLLLEWPEAVWTDARARLLGRFPPAGLLFRRLTTPASAAEVSSKSARALDAVPLLAIEEEGGGALAGLLPALPRLSQLDSKGAEKAGDLTGRAMAMLGLNLNLAPTLDLPARSANHSSLDTARDESQPAEVASRAQGFVRGLSAHHVLACGRHFPGLPAPQVPAKTARSGATGLIVVDRSLAALWREDLVPYRKLGDKLAMVEITEAVHRAYDYEFLRPASLSSGVIEGLLRTKLGYQGVALADASRAAQAADISVDEAAVRGVAAGCDLVLIPGEEDLLQAVAEALERGVGSTRLTRDRVEQALGRAKAARKRLRSPKRNLVQGELAQLTREFEEFARTRAER